MYGLGLGVLRIPPPSTVRSFTVDDPHGRVTTLKVHLHANMDGEQFILQPKVMRPEDRMPLHKICDSPSDRRYVLDNLSQARSRIRTQESRLVSRNAFRLQVGNFERLPWTRGYMDALSRYIVEL